MKSMNGIITAESIVEFKSWLCSEDRSGGTIEKYIRDVTALMIWLDGQVVTQKSVSEWKSSLLGKGYQPVTVNSMLASIHAYCKCVGIDCRIRYIRIQKKLFRDEDRELTRGEYERLVTAAKTQGKERLALLLETMGSTGVRVSEVGYITVEGAKAGKIQISLKGKIRVIMLPKKICRRLLCYAKKKKILSGEIFITKSGKGLSRKQIWADMKKICKIANVPESKVFPHNLRHLFARVFYKVTHDVARLADVLGHSSIETTRIYLLSSGKEHARQLEALGLIL